MDPSKGKANTDPGQLQQKPQDKHAPRHSSVTPLELKNLNQQNAAQPGAVDDQEDEEERFHQLFRSINDYDSLSIVWSNTILVCNLYNQITCFYFLGLPGFPSSWWLVIEFLMEIVLIFDVCLRILFQVYLRRQWRTMGIVHDKNEDKFHQKAFYLLSSLPTSIILSVSMPPSALSQLWVAFVRTLKVLRLSQLDQYFDVRDIRTKRNSSLRTFQSILYILLITHFLGCFWLFVGRVDPNQDLNWFKLVEYNLYDVPQIQKYVDAVFFTVSSMTGLGFGYIYPRTNLEYAMQSMLMVVGVSVYANAFGHFAVSIYNRNKKMIENMNKLQETKRLAVLRNFPNDIRASIRYFYNDLRLKYDSLCDKFNILEEMPNSLKSELSLFINSEIIQKVNFFQFAEPSFILMISKSLRPELSLADNFIIYKGEVADRMYFVKSGIVSVISTDNKTVIAYMSEGTYFGEIGVLLTQKRTCYVKSRSVCVFFTISSDDLISALKSNPIQEKFLKSVARQRLQTTEPSDLIDQDYEFEQQAKDQMNINIYDQVSHIGSMFGINNNAKEKKLMRKESLMQLETMRQSQQEKVKVNLTEQYKLFNLWTFVFLIGVTFNILYVPFSLGLDYDIYDEYYAIDVFAILIMLGDSLLRPFLAVDKQLPWLDFPRDYEIEIMRNKILTQYVHRYLLLDLLSTVPFDYLLLAIDGTRYLRQFIRLLRLLKMYRINEIITLIRKHTSIDQPFFRIFLMSLIYLVLAHWFNCLLIQIAVWELYRHDRFDGKTLLNQMTALPYSVVPPAQKMTKWQLYANLLLLCICYMGSIMYGDIIPFTMSEETLGIVQMILGRMFISFLFAEVSSIVQARYQTYNHHISIKNRVNKWMQLNNIERPIRKRVNKFFDYKWKHQRGVEEEDIIYDLPTNLRVNVKNFIFDSLMKSSDVFPKDNPGFTATITSKLQRRIVPKDEFVLRQGELATEMFFIMKGEVDVVTQDGKKVATLKKHKHFGEMALIEKKALLRSTSILAATNCVLAVLTKKDFDMICFHYPDFSNQLRKIQEQRTKDSLAKGIMMSFKRNTSIVNQALNRLLTQRKTIPLLNDDQGVLKLEQYKKGQSEQVNKAKQMNVQFESGSDLEESDISDEKKDPLNDTNSNANQDIAALNAQNTFAGNLENANLRVNTMQTQLPAFERDPNGLLTPQVTSKNSLFSSIKKIQKISQQQDKVETLNTETPLATEAPLTANIPKELAQIGTEKLGSAQMLSSSNNLQKYIKGIKESKPATKLKLVLVLIMQTIRQVVLFFLSLYNVIFIPLQMGFSIAFQGWILYIELATIAVYFVDAVIIYNNLKLLQKKQRQIQQQGLELPKKSKQDKDEMANRIRYLKLNLASTIVATIPFSLVFYQRNNALFIVNYLRVLRIVKIWPFYKFLQLLKVYNVNFIRWIEVLITYYFVAHILAGVILSDALTNPDILRTWLNRIPSPQPDGVRQENNLDGVSNQSLYISALYFITNTISHVAIGDITTVSTQERILNIYIIWNLTFFYAFSFANISSIVSDFLGSNFLTFHEKFSNVRSLISRQKTPHQVMEKINNYYDYLWIHSQGFDEQKEVFKELPTQIKYDMMKSRFQEAISNSLIFKNENGGIDDPLVNSIFELMQIRTYMNNEYIIKCGSYGRNMYLILDGEAVMFGINNELVCILKSGTHFSNELEEDIEENYGGKRLCHLIAKSITVVGVIDQVVVSQLLEAYPFFKQLILKLNYALFKRSKYMLERYKQSLGVQQQPYAQEIAMLENHLTFSDDSIYEGLIIKMNESRYQFLYKQDSEAYKKFDFLHNQIKLFHEETGMIKIGDMNKMDDTQFISRTSDMIVGSRTQYEDNECKKKNDCKGCFSRIFFAAVSRRRKLLDFIHLINMIYMAIGIPLQIAFIDSMEVSLVFETMSILAQILVVFINFRTPTLVKGGFTLRFCSVLRSYYNNGLIYDLMGILPTNIVLGYMAITQPNIAVISVIRLLRILAIQKLLVTFEKFEIHMKNLSIFMYICKTILILFLLWHWTACFWFFINHRIEQNMYALTWYKVFSLDQKTMIEKYLYSFYYVIKIVTGTGQSDMITYNDLERICFMIIINIGDTLFAFAFGLIASIQLHISQNSDFQIFLQKMKLIDEFLGSINFEESHCQRVEQYFAYSFFIRQRTQLVEMKDLRHLLPYALLKDVLYYNQRDILAPMFKAFKSDNLMREVASVLTNVIFMPGDYIIYKDQIGEEMYFIVEGQVLIIAGDKSTVLKTLSKGSYFGEIAIFMHSKRISYVQAKEFCVVSMLRKTDLDQIVMNFPEVSKQFKLEAERRVKETQELEKKRLAESQANQEEEEDDIELSFINALTRKMDDSLYDSPNSSERELLQNVKKGSENIDHNKLQPKNSWTDGNNNRLQNFPTISIQRPSTMLEPVIEEEALKINEDDEYEQMMEEVLAYESKGEDEENKQEYNKQKTISDGSNKIKEIRLGGLIKSIQSEEFKNSIIDNSDESDNESPLPIQIRFTPQPLTVPKKSSLMKRSSYLPDSPQLRRQNNSDNGAPSFAFEEKLVHEITIKNQNVNNNGQQTVRQDTNKRRMTEFQIPSKLSLDLLRSRSTMRREPGPSDIFKIQTNSEAETVSIRRQAKKKYVRRLSKISLGKNLMLSQAAGLKLQWTVGK